MVVGDEMMRESWGQMRREQEGGVELSRGGWGFESSNSLGKAALCSDRNDS